MEKLEATVADDILERYSRIDSEAYHSSHHVALRKFAFFPLDSKLFDACIDQLPRVLAVKDGKT